MRHRSAVLVGLAAASVFVGTLVPGRSGAQGPGASVAAWVDSLAFDDGAIAGIELFAREKEGGIGEGYARELSAGVRKRISADVRSALDRLAAGERSGGGGGPFIDVSVLEPGFASDGKTPDDPIQQEFEKSFVRTEVLAFFADEDTTPRAALDIYTDAGFRKAASPRIERIWNEGEEICVALSGVRLVLDPMAYCDRVENHHEENLSVQHSQAVRNTEDSGHQTVFFKESLKTFVRLPDGLAFHYINYSRTIGMGGVKKRFGLGRIKESEAKAVEELGRRLAAAETKPAE